MALQSELEESWVIDIQQKLELGGLVEKDELWTKQSIYKIPSWLKDEGPHEDRISGYIPEIISFGPYHHGQSRLQPMESHKWRVVDHMLKRQSQDITLYLTEFHELEPKARACYKWPLSLTTNQLVEIMVIDGCFILEFLRGTTVGYETLGYSYSDPVFFRESICHLIAIDLIKLENQIPLIVLEKLLEVQGNANIPDVPRLIMSTFTPNWITLKTPTDAHLNQMWDVVAQEPMVHCLDVFRKSLMYKAQGLVHPNTGGSGSGAKSDDSERLRAMCVFELKVAGIKFKPRDKLPFWEIQFHESSGVLEIPPLKINNATETLLRNLIAFEQCHITNLEDMVVTNYVAFIDNLINTSADVGYLYEDGIIVHSLGSDGEVADLFNKLTKNVYFSKKAGGLLDVYLRLNNYSSHRRNWWRASLRNEYLSNPWIIISIFAAISLFILTVIQTFYTVYAYYKPPS